jgi:hypothetical protein
VLELPVPPAAIVARVRRRLARDRTIVGRVHPRTLLLTVHPRAAHFWSPHLDVQLTRDGDGTRLSALFAPHPQLWGIFVSLQILFVILSLAAGTYVTAVWRIGNDPTDSLLALGACLLGGALSFSTSWVGRALGAEQMHVLRAFLDRALADAPGSRGARGPSDEAEDEGD